MKIIYDVLVGAVTTVITWLSLSYIFFPIKLSAPADEYFKATMTHMIPLKLVLTILFVLFSVFIYNKIINKSEKNDRY
jgi:hypothetical protein